MKEIFIKRIMENPFPLTVSHELLREWAEDSQAKDKEIETLKAELATYKSENPRDKEDCDNCTRYKILNEALEDFVKESPCDPDIYPAQLKAWTKYNELKEEIIA